MSMPSALHPTALRVVIPCRNCEQWIGPCLESLLEQDFTQWSALVADDCSDDGTAEAVRPYLDDPRIEYRRLDERAWLMGNTLDSLRSIRAEPGDVTAIMDGDDHLLPGALQAVWDGHLQGYDIVYTDEVNQGQDWSVGRAPVPGVPIRRQLWCFSKLRTFKHYLFPMVPDAAFRGPDGRYVRAAGDLSLFLPLAELAGPEKIRFIPERLYFYRVHANCNFAVRRDESLRNNWHIREQPPLDRQHEFFDYTVRLNALDKGEMYDFARRVRAEHPLPHTVRVVLPVEPGGTDFWRAYHGLWIEQGVFFEVEEQG